jgi:hypothetical protein
LRLSCVVTHVFRPSTQVLSVDITLAFIQMGLLSVYVIWGPLKGYIPHYLSH